MKHYKIDIYDKFECIGSFCPNTCCTGWPIGIDDAATQDYEDVPEDFPQRSKEGIHEKKDISISSGMLLEHALF